MAVPTLEKSGMTNATPAILLPPPLLGVEVVREVLCTCGIMPEVASQVKEYHVVHGKGLDVVVM